MYLNPAAMFPWWQKTPSKLLWEQETALKNDKSKSALQVMTAKLEARKATEDAQKDIRSWLIVQSILPVTSQGHRGQEMWHSAPSSVSKKIEQSITTARIYTEVVPICSYLLFDLFVSLSCKVCWEKTGTKQSSRGWWPRGWGHLLSSSALHHERNGLWVLRWCPCS